MCVFRFWQFGLMGGLMLLCSCATQNPVRPQIPAEVAFNEDTRNDERVYLTVHLADGKPLLFIADTGATGTVLDKSLEPRLGKCLAKTRVNYPFFGKTNLNVYAAPKLYLGDTLLKIGRRIMTDDLSRLSNSPPLMGILGMDCLRYYCIQLDSAAGKIRFLDPDYLAGTNLGEAFPLTFSLLRGLPSIHTNLFWPAKTSFGIDTGCKFDAVLKPSLFRRELRVLPDQTLGTFNYNRQYTNFAGAPVNEEFLPQIIFNGEDCTNFVLEEWPGEDLIGLRFLARHEVTLNFPKRMMYLRHSNAESFASKDSITNSFSNWDFAAYRFTSDAVAFLLRLAEKHELPGIAKSEHGHGTFSSDFKAGEYRPETYPMSVIFVVTKASGIAQYRYEIVQSSKDSQLELKRAWRTDGRGRVVQEYRVP
jgi:hypothetical protein